MSIQGSINQIAGIIGGEIQESQQMEIEAQKESEKSANAAQSAATKNQKTLSDKYTQQAIDSLQENYNLQKITIQDLQDRIGYLQERQNNPNFAVDTLKAAGVLSNTRAKDITHQLKKVGDKVVET